MREKQHLKQLIVRQPLCPCLHNSFAQTAAVAEVMRAGGGGILEPGAENLLAKLFDTLFVTSVEQPDQPPSIPGSTELTSTCRKLRMIGTSDGDFPVPFKNRKRHDR